MKSLKYDIRWLVNLISICVVLFVGNSLAAEEFKTNAGYMTITLMVGGEPVTIKTGKVLILLDYESGKINMKLNLSDLISDDPSIADKLKSYKDQNMQFEGKLGLDYINTQGHPPLDFNIEGLLEPANKPILGKGRLIHIAEGTKNACVLSISFLLKLDDLFPELSLDTINRNVNVNIIQSLLSRVND